MSSNFINTLYINSYVSLIGTRQICVPSFKVLSEYVRFEWICLLYQWRLVMKTPYFHEITFIVILGRHCETPCILNNDHR